MLSVTRNSKRPFLYILVSLWVWVAGLSIPSTAYAWQSTIEQLQTSLQAARDADDDVQIASVLFRLGDAYLVNGQPNQAIEAYKEALQINEEKGNNNAIAIISSGLGKAYQDLNQFTESVNYFNRAIQAYQAMGKKRELAGEYINLSNTRSYSGQYAEANSAAEIGLDLAKELQDANLLKTFYLLLFESHQAMGNTEEASEAYQQYTIWKGQLDRAQLDNQTRQAQQAQQQLNQRDQQLEQTTQILDSTSQELNATKQLAELRKQRIADLDEKERLQEENNLRLQKQLEAEEEAQQYLIIGIMVAFALTLYILRGLMINRRKNAILATQNNEIHQQKIELMVQRDKIRSKSKQLEAALVEIKDANTKITSSINYAKRIQEAMLPAADSISQHLPDSFVLFKPRDIVSGDFYWYTHLPGPNNNGDGRTIISAIDCTGHGVPGAFMSMIGTELLNKIVLMQRFTKPGQIVTELHNQVRLALNQEKTENKDGMDLAMCTIHGDGKTLEYSGAQNPLVYIQDGEIHQVKATRYSVGGIQKERERIYENHTLVFDKPTWVYLFSDGYPDQFGGETGRKFMIKRMKNLLLEIHQKPMTDQQRILNDTIEDWRGTYRQIDDILVIGFKMG
ncbi:MAG TPA: hypothetical protein DCE41_11440 [Cytophagales bacterium]|nr:hypothetical protein [Cytophagales bacterium]HAA22308.1 hypothetical protein [Cytophagales bacterium]HAP60479.1 hypothetical protein [Cytophagales bacterium]